MLDRFLNGALRLTVLGMIMLTAGITLIFAYYGLLEICTRHFAAGGTRVALALGLGTAALLLCRHANDLMDR